MTHEDGDLEKLLLVPDSGKLPVELLEADAFERDDRDYDSRDGDPEVLKLVSPYDEANEQGKFPDAPAYAKEEELIELLSKKQAALIEAVTSAASPIPKGLAKLQETALRGLQAREAARANQLVNEFSLLLEHGRRSRWLSYQTYCDGQETLQTVLQAATRARAAR